MNRVRVKRSSTSCTIGIIERVLLIGVVCLFASCTATLHGPPSITQVKVPSNSIHGIAISSDGSLWFTHGCLGVSHMTAPGVTSIFRLPPIPNVGGARKTRALLPTRCAEPSSGIGSIAIDANGSLWFTDASAAIIGRMTRKGKVHYYTLPNRWTAQQIVCDPKGAIWFTQMHGNAIGRISPTGRISEYFLKANGSYPYDIVVGSDGALWFTEFGTGQIGRLTRNGVLHEYTIPTARSAPLSLAVASDGSMWFTEVAAQKIGRITTGGVITEYPLPNTGPGPDFIAAGKKGVLWFTETESHKVGRISTSGRVSEYDVPSIPIPPTGRDEDGVRRISTALQPLAYIIVKGRAGSMWFTEPGSYYIGKIQN